MVLQSSSQISREAGFESLLELVPDLICIASTDGYLKWVNSAFERVLGYTREELLTTPYFELVHPDDRNGTASEFMERAASGPLLSFINRYLAKDGTYHWLEWNAHSATEQGLIYATARDVTTQRQAGEALQASEQLFKTIFRASPAAIVLSDLDNGRIVDINDAFSELFGYSRDEAIGRTTLELGLWPDAANRTAVMQRVAEIGRVRDMEATLTTRLGVEVQVLRAVELQTIGEQDLAVYVITDVSDRRQAEAALEEAERRLNAIMNFVDSAIVLINADDGLIESFNPAAEQIFGYSKDEVLGQHSDLLWSEQPEALDAASARDLDLLGFGHLVQGRHKDGPTFTVSMHMSETSIGNKPKFIAALRDVTSRRLAAEALRKAEARADSANRAKSEFLSRMSHELRTPLNVVLGFGQLLEMEPLTPPQLESVEHILKASSHLLDLIDEILNLSGIEAGRIELTAVPVPVEPLLLEVIALMSPIATATNVRIENAMSGRFTVLADQQRLKQVLLNLVSNGIKYNRHGGSVSLDASENADGHIRITVTDSGRGLTPDQVEKLFTPFERLDAATSGIEGTGLGLALSRGLTEAMKGKIGVESTPGEGSTFWIELPSCADQMTRTSENLTVAVPARLAAHAGKTVVYVEDNLENIALVERIFEFRPGLELIPVGQGMLALDLIREHTPDLVLLDLHLPDISGFEVFQRLQADPSTRSIPVVVASADATDGQIRRLNEAGVREYLTKPFKVKQFLEILDDVLSPQT